MRGSYKFKYGDIGAMKIQKHRCQWAEGDPLLIDYHDNEWGKPVFCDVTLFEFLVLEGAQAGLNWLTILKKREGYREAFEGFDPEKVARFGEEKIVDLCKNPSIIRNRLKIASAVNNARCFLDVEKEYGSFASFLWDFVHGSPVVNRWERMEMVPAQSPLSEKVSRALKKRGFTFVGPVICYSYLQAVGIIDDHVKDCFCAVS
jgi:DNA-3-methyladenine glycosylase I